MDDLRHPTFIPFAPQPDDSHESNNLRHVTYVKPPSKRRDFEDPTPQPDTLLISLCKQQKWDQVLLRCETHPHEAAPNFLKKLIEPHNPSPWKRDRSCVSIQGHTLRRFSTISRIPSFPVFEQTALGMVCSAGVESDTKLRLIRALLKAYPEQLSTPQHAQGCTPLRDLINSPLCEVAHLTTLLEMDRSLVAITAQDMIGLTPLDHLVMRLHLDPCDSNVRLFCCYVDFIKDKPITSSPIIRLLSLSKSPGVGNQTENKSSKAIFKCTQYLLQTIPSCINDVSNSSRCSVLHVALRNFGDQLSLIQLLLETIESNSLLAHRNVFGDLPLHVACAGGSPLNVLKLVLTRSLKAAPLPVEGPHPLLWSTNYSGYTAVDLEWMRHIEGGGGIYERRTFYPLEERGLHCQSPSQEGLYRNLLQKAVTQVMKGNRDTSFVGSLLDRIILIIQMAHGAETICEDNVLHAVASLESATGPSLPQPFLFLFHWMHKDKTNIFDEKGRLPLHYALMNHQVSTKKSPYQADLKVTKATAWLEMLIDSFPDGVKFADKALRLPLHYALDSPSGSWDIINKLVHNHPESLERRDPITGLYPFQQASTSDLDTCFHLLRQSPNLVASSLHNS
jgi:hypothetical protein